MEKYAGSHTDELIHLISHECFGDYFSKVHMGLNTGRIRLNDIETLLKNLCDNRLELIKSGYEDWKYIRSDKAYEMGMRCIFNELKKLLLDRRALLKDGIMTIGDQRLNLSKVEMGLKSALNEIRVILKQSPELFEGRETMWEIEDIIEEINEFNQFISESFQQIYHYLDSGNKLIYKLLAHFKTEKALAIFAVIEHITERLSQVHSEDDIQDYYMIGETPKEIIEWVDRYTTGDICFAERAAAEEIIFFEKAHERMNNAKSFNEYIIGATEANFWLQNSLSFLGTAYRVLTNQNA